MITNRILNILLLVIGTVLIPVQIITTLVLGIAVTLTFDLLLIPIGMVWSILLYPMIAVSWIGHKVPVLREVLGIIFIPWVILAGVYAQLMPSMGLADRRSARQMMCGTWPYTWEFTQFLDGEFDLNAPNSVAATVNKVVKELSSGVILYQRVLKRVAAGEQLDT
jgi:hypothetical protein